MGAPSPLKHSSDCSVNSTGECDCGIYEASAWAAAATETKRLQCELDISNADHVALWLESNTIPDEPMSQCISWLACRIVEAYEAAAAEPYEALCLLVAHERAIKIDIGAHHANHLRTADDLTVVQDANFRTELEAAFDKARAAIAKARGEAA